MILPTESVGSCPGEVHFSTAVTRLMALVLVAGMGFFIWLQISIPRLDRVGFPERALSHLVSRTLEMEEAIAHAPPWERALYQWTTDNGSSDLGEAIAWYQELADVSYNPDTHLYLAILEAEAGRFEDLGRQLKEWDRREDPFPKFARMMRAAYVDPQVDPTIARSLQAELADVLPIGWFYDKMALRVAERSSDQDLLMSITSESAARVMPLLRKVRLITAGELTIVLLGVFTLFMLLRRRGEAYPVGSASIPPVWRGRLGVAVLVRGGAMGLLLSVAFLFLESDSLLIRVAGIPLASLPLLVLTRQYLLAPHGIGFLTGFGLRLSPSGQGRLIVAVFAVLAAGLIGEWGLGLLAEEWGLSSHWTEWFDADLVWGRGPVVMISLLEFVVLAPLFEELAFRGLIFGTLRRRFNWAISAAISAGIFAIAHGYGVLGFISVFWSGLLWAWIYEKTGSLLPSMLAHAANNLLVCVSILYFFRS
ncbi:MAG TPA: type II CAAX endopeptidase family protein [Nitrospiraceae bacterium]|nr:type II CAAX endopeptidase family protein [Nitrospiraceae bacterium]